MEIFQNSKSNHNSSISNLKNFNINEKASTIPFLINKDKMFFLEDYPIFIDEIYDKEASILSINYFNKSKLILNEFKLWFQLAQM